MRNGETSITPNAALEGLPVNGKSGPTTPMTPLAREALDWVVHIGSGEATVKAVRSLSEWRARSPEHEAAFREAVRVRRGLETMLQLRAADTVAVFQPRSARASRRVFLAGGGAIAASIVGGVMVARPPLGLWPSYAELTADYRTGPGEHRTISPIAGVNVEMNTRTSVGRGSSGPAIHLIVGEAFVTVDRQAAFTATADGGEIRATRAAFNLRNINGEVCVTCLEGQVSVLRREARADLLAGHEILYSADHFGEIGRANDVTAAAWRSGLLIFNGESLGRVVAEINRYREGRILLTDRGLARRPVSAIFHLDQMANAVTQVEQLVGVRGTYLPGDVVLIG